MKECFIHHEDITNFEDRKVTHFIHSRTNVIETEKTEIQNETAVQLTTPNPACPRSFHCPRSISLKDRRHIKYDNHVTFVALLFNLLIIKKFLLLPART